MSLANFRCLLLSLNPKLRLQKCGTFKITNGGKGNQCFWEKERLEAREVNINRHRNDFIMIDRISRNISLEEFQKLHLLPNRPCILSAEFTKSWNSRRDWVDGNGMPNFTYLAENFGRCCKQSIIHKVTLKMMSI